MAWWKCNKCGYSWEATPHNRTQYKKSGGCPACANKIATASNCFRNSKEFSYLLPEWDYEANSMLPEDICCGTTKKIHWKCKNGHKWIASMHSRTGDRKSGCPHCSKIELLDGTILDSHTEAYYYLLFKQNNTKIELHKLYPNSRKKCDFYIPAENKYIEVTSFSRKNMFHKNFSYHMHYLRRIATKKQMAIKANAKFEFIQKYLSGEEKALVEKEIRENRLGYK